MSDPSSSSANGVANGDAQKPQEIESHPYTLQTLKAHGTREDLWMLLHGKVYDVTKFLDEVSILWVWNASQSAFRSLAQSRGHWEEIHGWSQISGWVIGYTAVDYEAIPDRPKAPGSSVDHEGENVDTRRVP